MAQQLHRAADTARERQSPQQTGRPESQQGQQDMERQEAGRQEGGQQARGGQQQKGQGASRSDGQRSQAGAMSVPMIAMRGVGQFYDMQLAATRMLLQTQASAARAFGLPDFSGLFRIDDERAKRVFSSGTEQLLHLARQANETTSEVQRHMGRMMEYHAVNAAENWQRGLEELGAQAEESLEQLKELTRQQAEEAMQVAQDLGKETQRTIREGGEEFRQTMRQGAENTRQFSEEQGEAVRHQGEQAGSDIRQGMREGRQAAESGQQQGAGEEEQQGGQERNAPRRRAA